MLARITATIIGRMWEIWPVSSKHITAVETVWVTAPVNAAAPAEEETYLATNVILHIHFSMVSLVHTHHWHFYNKENLAIDNVKPKPESKMDFRKLDACTASWAGHMASLKYPQPSSIDQRHQTCASPKQTEPQSVHLRCSNINIKA